MQKFVSDYMEGAHPLILKALCDTNMEKTDGYGFDPYTDRAKERIRESACCPDAEVFFLIGGTQTNETVISSLLSPYEGVLSAETGHINTHEAGAIEHGGHKVLTLKGREGKISASDVRAYMEHFLADENHEHEVFPGVIYLSEPTEYGTIYTKEELQEFRRTADDYGLRIYVDGARLGYALAADPSLRMADLSANTDVYSIGGTKVGALFGEAVVFPKGAPPHFYTITKLHGAMLAKGRILGIQFDTLFQDNLYLEISRNAVREARRIREALLQKGYELYIDSPTNQIFTIVTKEKAKALREKVLYGFMEELGDGRLVIRFCTSWASRPEDVDELISIL